MSILDRRSFLTTGAAGAVAAGLGATESAAQGAMRWDLTADVVMIGAGVAGLPAAITARDAGASVIVVEENFDIGGRGMLSGGRVQLGGGHALQQKFDIKDDADQVFLDWVRHDHGESRYSDRELVRVFADENVSTFDFLIENGVEFIEKPIKPPDASTVDAHLRHQGMAHPERGDRAAPQPQRLGPGAPAGRKRAQEGRADPAQAQDDARSCASSRNSGRVLGIDGASTAATHRQHPRHQGRHHRHRRPHRQRQLPPHVRSAADRGIPAGLRALRRPGRRRRARRDGHRRLAVGDRQSRPPRPAPPSPRRGTSAAAGATPRWSTSPTASMFPQAQGDRPHREGLAEPDHGQPVRPAVLERGRRLVQVLQRRDGLPRRQDAS